MSRPSEQRNTISPSWWVRLCCWLWGKRWLLWSTIILGTVISAFGAWLFTPWGTDFTKLPIGWAVKNPGIILLAGICLLLLTLLVGVVCHLTGAYTRVSEASDLQQSRGALIRLLRGEYRRQITESLQGATMMALALKQRTDVVRSSAPLVSWRIDEPGETSLPSPVSIVQAYDDAGRGLLILGAPGTGKSTLLRELASELLTRAEDDATQPIPVNVNLSSWAIKKPPLTTWMVDRLWETYNIQRHLSQALIEQNQLLFLLDGLDEVESSARTKCIETINAYLAEQEHIIPIVVCSRSHEYLEQGEQLRLSVAVEVRPLTSEQVESYLKDAGRRLAAVRATLRSNAVLRELITTPLMLHVVILAYRDKMVKDLPQLGSAEEQQNQVFECYVTRMLENRVRKWRYASSQTRQGLIWLAQQMQQQQFTEFYLERLQPAWLTNKRYKAIYGLVTGLFLGLLSGLLLGLVYGLAMGLVYGLSVGLVTGLISELVIGLIFGLIGWVIREDRIQLAEVPVWSWSSFLKGLRSTLRHWLVPVLTIALCSLLLVKSLTGLFILLGIYLGIYLIIGFIGGLFSGLSSKEIQERVQFTPNQGIRNSGWNALRVGIISMLIVGLTAGLLFWPLVGLTNGLSNAFRFGLFIGLFFGPIAGLGFGLGNGGVAFLKHYMLRFMLWRTTAIPWHYVRFLEEATIRILLQHVGGGYRFIHPLFQEYFASLATSAPSHSTEKPSSQQP